MSQAFKGKRSEWQSVNVWTACRSSVCRAEARVEAYNNQEMISDPTSDSASKLKTSNEKEKLLLLEKVAHQYSTKFDNFSNDVCTYNIARNQKCQQESKWEQETWKGRDA